jgi:putative FmdB family regulatory protein
MPLYPYLCRDCETEFEKLTPRANGPATATECPACGGMNTERRFGVPAKSPVRPTVTAFADSCGVGPPCGAVGCRRKLVGEG